MKKNINKILTSRLFLIVCFFGTILGASSCNKEFNNVLPQSFKNDTAGLGAGSKVLYIILDGVKGSELQTLAPTNITLLNRKATYSFDALSDSKTNVITDASAWTTMITGVDYTKHHVTSEDFAGLDLQATPTIFKRVKDNKANARTASFASVALFNDKLAGDATVKQTLATDVAVKTAAVSEISANNPTLVVAQFHGAETAGIQGGFVSTNTNYAQSIKTLDGYVGELLAAIKARKAYGSENWLIVISSNKIGGPSGGDFSANPFEDQSRNIFMAYYNLKFAPTKVAKPDPNSFPFTGTAPRISGDKSAVQTNTAIGNFGNTGEFTYMFKWRDDNGNGQYYPYFMGKRQDLGAVHGGDPGWTLLKAGNDFQSYIFGSRIDKGDSMSDGKWHTYAFTIRNINGTRTFTVYFDGQNIGSRGYTNTDNNFPLRLQGEPNNGINMLFRDIALFNVGMNDADVAKTMRSQLAPGDNFYDKLIGYWPGDETEGTIMYDKVGNNNFTYSDGMQFSSFEEISPNISPRLTEDTFRSVPNAVDAPLLVYNWLGIAVSSQWNLSGKLFIPKLNLPTN
ncbi:DUF4983 domain-containing protein [Pedobacter changchengzhani]|uniref:DUF4983 domain-containing protein n=1 Tax=Pedobacter changchengzhani TaxID=2529274 RepID=A0A4R5MKM8_9SPHI|nr:DUF4983 domain-containing protein [Pedobacter changchengzhani]TDG36224.1 DUF4983 domain-containing protein [Pedobacter changchengzhani]